MASSLTTTGRTEVLDIGQRVQPTSSLVQPNEWVTYFGPTQGPLVSDANADFSYDRFDLPRAYVGRNLFLRNIIEGFIINNDLFFTRTILPIFKTDQLNISFNVWSFDATLAGRVPHEGVSRLIRSQRSSHSDKLQRRGLAFTQLNIQQIVQAVQTTLNFDVLAALLTCKRYDKQWEREHGLYNGKLSEVFKREVATFAIVQKDVNGFDIMIEEYKKRMSYYGVGPDALILPSKVAIYIPMVPPEKVLYSNRGSLGVQQYEDGALSRIRDIAIYESRVFDLNHDNELPINLLASNVQIGQFNLMNDEHTNCTSASVYKNSHRDVYVFDAGKDNFHRVQFLDAIKNSFRFNSNGEIFYDFYKGMTLRDKKKPMDVFMYYDPDENKNKVATTFSQFFIDENNASKNYLTNETIELVVQTALNGFSEQTMDTLHKSARVIKQLQEATRTDINLNADTPLVYKHGDAGFGDSWFSLKCVAKQTSSTDPLTRQDAELAKLFIEAFEALYQHLYSRFPKSLLLLPDLNWIEDYFGPNITKNALFEQFSITPEDSGIAFLYAYTCFYSK